MEEPLPPSSSTPVNTWDRNWTLGELREESSKWTLASDAGVRFSPFHTEHQFLHYLEEFSNNFIAKTKNLEAQVDGLVFETKATNIRAHNVFNSFLMLSNTQFIENRVYDEEVQLLPEEETTPPAGEEKEGESEEVQRAQRDQQYRAALQCGLDVLASLSLPDSELSSSSPSPSLSLSSPTVAKDPLFHSPLPAIIGTREFNEDDLCGLVETIEEEEEEDEEEGEEGEADLPHKEEEESDFSVSDEEELPPTRPRGVSVASEGSEKSVDSEESAESVDSATARRRRIEGEGVALPGLSAILPPSESSEQKKKEKKEKKERKKKEKREKKEKGRKKEEEDESTADLSKPKENEEEKEKEKQKQKEKEESSDLFGDTDLFADADSFLGFAAKPRAPLTGLSSLESLEQSLFADVEGALDPENLFGVPSQPKKEKKEEKEEKKNEKKEEKKTKSSMSLFGDEEEDSSLPSLGETTLPLPSSSSPSKSSSSLFDSSDPSDSLFGASEPSSLFGGENIFATKPSQPSQKVTKPAAKQTVSLWGDEEEDSGGLFGSESLFPPKGKKEQKTEEKEKKESKENVKIETNETAKEKEIEEKKVTADPPKKKFAGSVAMPGMDSLFGSSESKPSLKQEKTKEEGKEKPSTSKSRTMSLFGDEEEQSDNWLFGDKLKDAKPKDEKKDQVKKEEPKKEEVKKEEPKKEDTKKEEPKKEEPKKEETKKVPSKNFSLFGDEEEEEIGGGGGLFGSTKSSLFDFPKEEKQKTVPPEPKKEEKPSKASASLFGDSDSLFPSTPSVPSTKSPPVPSTSTPSVPSPSTPSVSTPSVSTPSPTPSRAPSSTASLFGDAEEEDPLGFLGEKKKESQGIAAKKEALLKKEEPVGPVGKTEGEGKSQKVKQLQEKLALNPSLMLSGSRPRKSSSVPTPSDSFSAEDNSSHPSAFESSARSEKSEENTSGSGEVLTSLTRSRPMAKGRRLPSRAKGGKSSTSAASTRTSSVKVSETSTSRTTPLATTPTSSAAAATPPASLFSTQPKEEKPKSDFLFGDISSASNVDSLASSIFGDFSPSPEVQKPKAVPKTTPAPSTPKVSPPSGSSTSHSIFDDLDTPAPSKPSPKIAEPPKESEPIPPKVITEEKKTAPKAEPKAELQTETVDIFSDATAKKVPPAAETAASIFSDPIQEKKKKPKKKKKSLFDD